MYSKPKIFKIYSVIMLALYAIYVLLIWQILSGTSLPFAEGISFGGAGVVIAVVLSCLLLLVAYAEFTSMYTFAQMIEHEQRGDNLPFKRMVIVASPQFYKIYGTVMFVITLVLNVASFVFEVAVSIIALSHEQISVWGFILLMLLFTVLCFALVFFSYILHYCKYRTFSSLLAMKKSVNVTDEIIQSLGKINPNLLRYFCVILYVLGIIHIVVSLLSILFVGGIGVYWTIRAVILFIPLGIVGCYTDNLAMMQEHYMIKYNLIDYKLLKT